MLVCSCNRLSDRDLRDAACRLAEEPGRQVVTPGAVFRGCGTRPRCGGCFPLVVEVVQKAIGDMPMRMSAVPRPCAGGCQCARHAGGHLGPDNDDHESLHDRPVAARHAAAELVGA